MAPHYNPSALLSFLLLADQSHVITEGLPPVLYYNLFAFLSPLLLADRSYVSSYNYWLTNLVL